MNLENGQPNLLYTGGRGDLCDEQEPSYYTSYLAAAAAAAGNEIGSLAYLQPQTNPNLLNYDLEEEMRQQHLELDGCNLNLVNLVNMSSSSSTNCSGWGLGSASCVLNEPVQLHLNQQKEPVRLAKNFVTERQRRQTFSDKFVHLRSLLPNPNKNDRASIVGDAIEYIKELTRTVKELSILVDKKKKKRRRMNDETEVKKEVQEEEPLRSSWLQRRCHDTDIDVRIVDDDVTVKLVQRKTMFNLLLYVSRTFDDMSLDLNHVTAGSVGDYCTFLFNTKISQGSSLYASAIADRLIQVLHRQYAAFH